MQIKSIYNLVATIYFVLATIALMTIAFVILASAIMDIVEAFSSPEHISTVALRSVGLLIIGFAIVETASFIADEEIFNKRGPRSPSESRRSLTEFVTIIVIASSLEALVMIFVASRSDVSNSYYAAMIFFVAMFGLVALGIYQWLSSRIQSGTDDSEQGR
jgi:threonine/homoserine/homoserine lactone efflux protein